MFAGAKGGSSSFKQTPDNLRSNDTFEAVLGLCIGPIKGATRGLKSVKVDGTAIENASGDKNFADFTALLADGDPLKFPQKIELKLGAGAAPTQVGVAITNSGGNNPVWVTKTLNNRGADFIDLRFIAQQIFRQDAKGIYTTTATLEIQMKPVGSTTWVNPTLGTPTARYSEAGQQTPTGLRQYILADNYDENGYYSAGTPNYQITGKTSSPSAYELRIGVPKTGAYANVQWDVRVRLLERDDYTGGKDNADQEKRTISWESLAAVYAGAMGEHEDWRGVASIQLYGKASDQLTGVPEIIGEYDTKIVNVPPSNIFDPETRVYQTGVWDGSWTKAYTNDPGWVLADAIGDALSGIALLAPGSYLNKWDALDLSKYCSTRVPDGNGGTQPRYCLNLSVSQPQKADEFIKYLAGAVGALAWDNGNGEWRCKVDKADAPVDIFTLDNIDGEFVYSHTDVDTRFNDITGKFKNAEMDYREDGVQLFDNTSIAKIGRKPTTIALVGCTDRQEAMRRVKLRLRATVNENRIVNFTTNRRGRNVEPLSTILIADGDLGDQNKQTTGRTIAVAADRKSIVVRDPMYLAPGIAYKMWFTIPNPDYLPDRTTQPTSTEWTKPTIAISRNVTNTASQTGAVTTIYLDAALPDSIADNLSVALEAPNLVTMPRLFRVTSVSPQDDGERIAISAVNIDIGKYDAADNVSPQDAVFQDLRGAVPAPELVNGNPLLSLITVNDGKTVNLAASWQRPASSTVAGFLVRYRINGGSWIVGVDRTQFTNFELNNPATGTYEFEIISIDRLGNHSLPLTGVLDVTQALIDATLIIMPDGRTLEESLKDIDDAALGLLELSDDDVITVNEKITKLIPLDKELLNTFTLLKNQADAITGFQIVTNAKGDAVNAKATWEQYRDGLTPGWKDLTQSTPVTRNVFDNQVVAYRNALTSLGQALRLYAQSNAQQALTRIDSIVSDGVLDRSEKPQVMLEVAAIEAETPALVARASARSISSTNYSNASSNIRTTLNKLNPSWTDTTQDSPLTGEVTRAVFRGVFVEYYNQKALLIGSLDSAAKLNEDKALDAIDKISSDGWLSRSEKPDLRIQWEALQERMATLVNRNDALGQPAETLDARSKAGTAVYTDLNGYLNGLSPSWTDTNSDTPINPTTFRDRWVAAYKAVGAFEAAMIGGVGQDIRNAVTAIQNANNDGYWSINEKITYIIPQDAILDNIWTFLNTRANAISDSTAVSDARGNASTARNNWINFRGSVRPFWDDKTKDSPINRTNADQAINNYETTLERLADALTFYAQGKATTAIDRLKAIDNDLILSRGEKWQLVMLWQSLTNRYQKTVNRYIDLGYPTSVTPKQQNAYNKVGPDGNSPTSSLGRRLGALSPSWIDTTQDTPIPSDLQQVWIDAEAAVDDFIASMMAQPNADNTSSAIARGDANTAINDKVNTSPKLLYIGTDGRITDARAITANLANGIRGLLDVPFIGVSNVGTGDSRGPCLCSTASSVQAYTDYGSVNYGVLYIENLQYSTTYFLYRPNVSNVTSTGFGWGKSTNLTDALGTNKVYVGFVTTVDAGGGGSTGGSNGGGSGGAAGGAGTDRCVGADSYVMLEKGPRLARDVKKGDRIVVLTEDLKGTEIVTVEANSIGPNWACTLNAGSAELTLSINTPMPIENGEYVIAANAWLHPIPIFKDEAVEWHRPEVAGVGEIDVAKITCHQRIYAASDKIDGPYIWSHNAIQKP
jgi:predicted phage tail protein